MHKRRLSAEKMDQPLPVSELESALLALNRIHKMCGSLGLLWTPIWKFAKHKRQLRIMDIACGNGYISEKLAQRLHNKGISVERLALDKNKESLMLLAKSSKNLPFRTETVTWDLNSSNELPCTADILVCSYFCHHLEDKQFGALLNQCYFACSGITVILDLLRSYKGYALAWLAPRLMTRSHIVHYDAPVSVQSSYSAKEFLTHIQESPWEKYEFKKVSFERLLFIGQSQAHG